MFLYRSHKSHTMSDETGTAHRAELWRFAIKLPLRMADGSFMGYACAIYQRAVQEQRYRHKKNPVAPRSLVRWTYLADLRCLLSAGTSGSTPCVKDPE